jgi:hypothetical protein
VPGPFLISGEHPFAEPIHVQLARTSEADLAIEGVEYTCDGWDWYVGLTGY